ncbi:uncharacterized protein Z520_01865 [Fonsecaea multimorphosa CBS 102226]|uniref:Uncharacterized protein n=1 Tax=Fonsecaea multimorphosa CBS 102226 TaxID=1442371 RepID=A0A0D2IXF4_9EURO|nr:uncharacterized protein Z520_01865 [Fonsecaea multimorphosa CBS 102226]KIY01727.1 hypothetical protein Z520_01865 [Fonsecaea multimorphosa CBS 102226]OAL29923.1 hypothetical protein AYO22_01829 [Fonsecaea multimorphosa]
MAPPIAIVTGGSSGIGAAFVAHLVSLGWNVVVADIHQPKHALSGTLYIHTDVSSWEQQADMFKQAYDWGGQRLDFCALNAGIDDRDDIFNTLSHDLHKPPKKPNTDTFAVNITGTYYGVKLAAHYMTLPGDPGTGKSKPGGKIIITGSGAGLFPSSSTPQYTTSKHALIGLVRALGKSDAALAAHVRINTLCPAIVDTGEGMPVGLLEKLLPGQITPMSTVLRGFDTLADLAGAGAEDWVERGPAGETLEAKVNDLIWHYSPERPKGGKGKSSSGESGAQATSAATAATTTTDPYKDGFHQGAARGEHTHFWYE